MHDLENWLVNCFCAVFPNRSRNEILSADRNSMEEWDSLAGVTLLALLQEKFGGDIDFGDLEQLGSFSATLKYVKEHGDTGDGTNAK
jgi:acyl carrier protein